MDRERELIMSTYIDSLTWSDAVERIMSWAKALEGRTVCLCNVHSVVTARSDLALREAINGCDIASPDGKPVAWLIGRRRKRSQARISGTELTYALCVEAARRDVAVAFYGSTDGTLFKLQEHLVQRFPGLTIVALISPPFRALSTEEDIEFRRRLNDSGAGIVFIGLGCPKQEVWMAANRDLVNAVTVGIGAAFEFIAGTVRRPPQWMQRAGLEWLGRLCAEPRRLWRRYLFTNSVFVGYLAHEFLSRKRHNIDP